MAGNAPKIKPEGHNRNLAPPLQELYNSPPVQTKLEIGEPGDKYEQEANKMADQVMMAPYDRSTMVMMAPNPDNPTLRMMPMPKKNIVMMAGSPDNPTSKLKPQLQKNEQMGYEEEEEIQMQTEEGTEKVQLMGANEEDEMIQPEMHQEEEILQQKPAIQKSEDSTTHASSALTASINATKGQGSMLPKDTKQELGSKMGADFSSIGIHTDSKAVQMNQELGAKAFTHGNDIYFNEGQYSPSSQSGKHLLAHELTHTIQQNGSQMIQKLSAFTYAIEISASVGDGGTNKADDVNRVMDRLVELGFLTTLNANAERPTATQLGTVPIPTMADASLPLFIAAIRSFQGTVAGMGTPDGNIARHGNSHRYLNTATAAPSAQDLIDITTARTGLGITSVSGIEELGTPLTGPVGDTAAGNALTDLTNIQTRLVELGRLSATHAAAEAHAAIVAANPTVYTTAPLLIQPAHIPRTIAAIRSFQRRERVARWATQGHLGTNAYTADVVDIDDTTFRLLRDFTVHSFTFADPANPGTNVNSSISGPVSSRHTVTSEGLVTSGTAHPALPLAEYTAYGLSNLEGTSLRWVENAEGAFDAMNTYDRAIVSFGFIQFAGERSLEKLLATIKNESPAEFETLFNAYGIDVEYSILRGVVNTANLTVIDVGTGNILRGVPALEAVRSSPAMTAAFVKAGYYIEVQRAQIELATTKYAIPARNTDIDFDFAVTTVVDATGAVQDIYVGDEATAFQATTQYTTLNASGLVANTVIATGAQKLSDVMRSEKGMAALISCYINLPGSLDNIFTAAILEEAQAQDADSWADVQALGDVAIIQHALADPALPGTWVHRLTAIIADAGLSSTK